MPDTSPVDTATERVLTDCWYVGAVSADVKPGQHIRRILLGEPVLIGRTPAGDPFAMRDVCPHRLVPLSAGRQLDTDGTPTVECPYHGWRFGTDGVCRLLPSLIGDEPYDPARIRVRSYPVHEAGGVLYIYVSEDPRSEATPRLAAPEPGKLTAPPRHVVTQKLDIHIDAAVAGLMAPARAPFIHRLGTFDGKPVEHALQPRDHGWAIQHAISPKSGPARTLLGSDISIEIDFSLPGLRWECVESPRGRLVTLIALTPETKTRTKLHQLTWWTGNHVLNLAGPALKRAARTIPALDSSAPEDWYRKLKADWAKLRAAGGNSR